MAMVAESGIEVVASVRFAIAISTQVKRVSAAIITKDSKTVKPRTEVEGDVDSA